MAGVSAIRRWVVAASVVRGSARAREAARIWSSRAMFSGEEMAAQIRRRPYQVRPYSPVTMRSGADAARVSM